MANKLRYTLTPSAPSRPKGVLCVVVGYQGTPQGRKSHPIDGLSSPDFRYWDKKAQCFSSGTDTAKANNPVLDAICTRCDELLNNSAITTPSEFIPDFVRKCFIQFSNFVLSLSDDDGKSNYLNIMKLFKQTHKKAFDRHRPNFRCIC